MASTKPDVGTRREVVIDAAIRQFSKAGYDGTTMRDISSVAGILPGSIYYHFPSKEELFIAVHEQSIQRICDSVMLAIDPNADAWTRLTQAAEGYLDSMLNNYPCASIIITEFPRRRSKKMRDRLISNRQRFEKLFAEIIEDLPLRKNVSLSYFRLGLLGMLAWTYIWHRPEGQDSPKKIAQKLVDLWKNGTV